MSAAEVVNIASHLPELARTRPYSWGVVCPAGRDRAGRPRHLHWTYRQLDRESDRYARGLAGLGIGQGTRTVLMVKPSLEFFGLTFALFKLGAVPVLIDPGMGTRNLGRCFAESEPEAFLGIPKAQYARRVFGWGKKTIRVALTVRPGLPGESFEGPAEPCLAPTRGEEVAAILFTSGSTGPPKGAVYTHANFAHQVEMVRRLYAIEPGEIDLCTFPLFALFAPALGMTAIVPEMDATRPGSVDPTKIIEAIESFGVTNMFGSPALVKRVGNHGASRGTKLPSLKRVISAGAPVPARVLETFATMLAENVQIFTPYGATEALPVASIGSAEILGETRRQTDRGAGVCVGRPVEGMRVEVIKISDSPIGDWSETLRVRDGEIGEIAVQGPVVTRTYFQRPESTALAKIADLGRESFWHRMGDLGYRDSLGRIWFCGRKAHRVIAPGGTLYTIPCEAVFNTHRLVERTALVGVGAPGNARPVLCVELKDRSHGRSALEQIRGELLTIGADHPHTRMIQTVLFHPSFPVDIRHNAKIFRERLASWAARKLS